MSIAPTPTPCMLCLEAVATGHDIEVQIPVCDACRRRLLGATAWLRIVGVAGCTHANPNRFKNAA